MNGFLGPAYNYDDHNLTEEWMTSFKSHSKQNPSNGSKNTSAKSTSSSSKSNSSSTTTNNTTFSNSNNTNNNTNNIAYQASEDDVIRTQLIGLLDVLLGQVQDRVCNSNGALDIPPIGLGPRLKEAPVWGIDSYTRKMIELIIIDNYNTLSTTQPSTSSPLSLKGVISEYIERKLLPAINRQSADDAHNIIYALNDIIHVS